MIIYLLVSIAALARKGNSSQPHKQVVGAKSFGALTIVLGIFQYYHLPLNWIGLTVMWVGASIAVYWLWHKNRQRKGIISY
jgi:ABC-type Mn2+/Zn2+ transport system permease subunit